MISRSFVLDLEGAGRLFRMKLQNLGFSPQTNPNSGEASELDFLYRECTSQILLNIHNDAFVTIQNLQYGPNITPMLHIKVLQESSIYPSFVEAFKEYATSLVFNINRKLGILESHDYLLDSVTPDYIIVNQITYAEH